MNNSIFKCMLEKEEFLNNSPKLIGVVDGVQFYRCPEFGDDVTLVAVDHTECGYSKYWDLPISLGNVDVLVIKGG